MSPRFRKPPIDRAWVRAGQGALLAPGAPLGWIALVWMFSGQPAAVLSADVWVLIYMLLGTLIVFTLFGLYVGRLEQRALDNGLHDALTGLPNRAFFDQRLVQLIAVAERQPLRPFALILVDLDHFKRINDKYGHAVGDQVLQQFTDALSGALRKGETLCRVGGEEFGLLAEDVDLSDGMALAERMREIAERVEHEVADDKVEIVTASFGVAAYDDRATPAGLFRRADEALYRAKGEGRNRVRGAD